MLDPVGDWDVTGSYDAFDLDLPLRTSEGRPGPPRRAV